MFKSEYMIIRTGPAPVNCEAPDSGYTICTVPVPLSKKSGSLDSLDALITRSGKAGHFRVYGFVGETDEISCLLQGSVSKIGEGGDLTLENDNLVEGFFLQIAGGITGGN